MLENFNPCFVLNLTATPKKESNIISYMDAVQLKNDDSREKISLGQAWRTAAGKDFRYYMVFENEENLLPRAVSISQFIDTVKAL